MGWADAVGGKDRLIFLYSFEGHPPLLALDAHKEIAAYLLPKLSSIKVEGEVAHLHASTSLQELFQIWEKEEEAERASLPPWTPPGFGALDMQQDGDGAWDLADEDDVED
jgi:hypothetical protein